MAKKKPSSPSQPVSSPVDSEAVQPISGESSASPQQPSLRTQAEQLQQFLEPQTRFRLQNPESTRLVALADEDFEFSVLSQGLFPAGSRLLEPAPVSHWPVAARPCYFMIEAHDGDWDTCRIFPGKEGLLARLRQLDGQDVVVHPAFGIPIVISRVSPDHPRIVFFHDNTAYFLDHALTPVEELFSPVAIQDDGFLGPEELVIVNPRHEERPGAPGGDYAQDQFLPLAGDENHGDQDEQDDLDSVDPDVDAGDTGSD